MNDPIREAQVRTAEFNAQARATQRANTPERAVLKELLASVEGYLKPNPWPEIQTTKARLILAMNSARNVLRVKQL